MHAKSWTGSRLGAAATVLFACLVLVACAQPASTTGTEDGASDAQSIYQQSKRQSQEDLKAQFPGVDIPDVHLVRFIAASEYAATRVQCLTEQGFSAAVMDDGGVAYGQPPAGQEQALAIADYLCSMRYPVDPTQNRMSDELLRTLYDYYVNDLIPCLEREGFRVEDIPSWTTFSEGYADTPWSPYNDVNPSTQEDWDQTNEACPQHPKSFTG